MKRETNFKDELEQIELLNTYTIFKYLVFK